MNRTKWFGSRRRPPNTARPCVELLETRNVMSGLGLTKLVQVSGASPLGSFIPPGGTTQIGSEVEPYLAVDPTNTLHVVAVYQQDRYTGSGARAIVARVSYDANAADGASWSPPAAIPGLDGSVATSAYQRYSDPWLSFAPDGTVYVSALGFSISNGVPRTAVLVARSSDGGATWSDPTTLIDNRPPPGGPPTQLLNDKESVTADPTQPGYAYIVWDRLNMPSDNENFEASHSFAFRTDTLFARTTDGGATWQTQVIFAPLANQQTIGHQIVVLPDGTLVDSFTLLDGSGKQPAKAAQNHLAVMRSTDHGATWSAPVLGPAIQQVDVTDPDTGAPVRAGEVLADVAVDPNNGNLYLAWSDGRFSNFQHNDIAFSMSTDGGLTWSDPIRINQAAPSLSDGNHQAFVPSIAVAANGTVAVTYYDFRNNTPAAGVPTDYWLVHASGALTNPASWTGDEKRLTDTSFDLELAPLASGYFLGDYEGLAAGGNNFYALFTQTGSGPDGKSNIWFRDPPPAAAVAAADPGPAALGDPGPPAAAPFNIPSALALLPGELSVPCTGPSPPSRSLQGAGSDDRREVYSPTLVAGTADGTLDAARQPVGCLSTGGSDGTLGEGLGTATGSVTDDPLDGLT
jgi:hypothetical protein